MGESWSSDDAPLSSSDVSVPPAAGFRSLSSDEFLALVVDDTSDGVLLDAATRRVEAAAGAELRDVKLLKMPRCRRSGGEAAATTEEGGKVVVGSGTIGFGFGEVGVGSAGRSGNSISGNGAFQKL